MITADRLPFVVAIDGGGTHTRVGCFGVDGTLLGAAFGGGGSPNHNHDAKEQVATTISGAISDGGLDPAAALAVGAGVAGFGFGARPQDAEAFLDLPGADCPKVLVNDAVIAHRGALLGRPGVIVVAGTGSMILGITKSGEQIPSGSLEHYAGGARHLVFDAIRRILLGQSEVHDGELLRAVLQHWQVTSIGELRRAIVDQAEIDRNEVKRKYGALAPVITDAVGSSPLAAASVGWLATRTADGVRLLGPLIGTDPVPVALIGSLATATGFADRFQGEIDSGVERETGRHDPMITVVPAALDPLRGAALMAYELAGLTVDDALIDRLGDGEDVRSQPLPA
ncbi:BadF/BadG/BcrA/BcrD ATPase family protein [Microlunatus sp. Gsoil 973]|uniref:BadF/BadG/BcrA/BcrD ATPase family protein n=1 Tax=Microlunatus sp. Gsoil 973 TaxID=2672569 RepID=UPI0018A836BC|nr:BadF/BadG/BcrA/BcrD ATPase family protein [Microlunatus sp. Gsoil 973]